MTSSHRSSPQDGLLARAVRRAAGASARRPKRVIALWLLFVVACTFAGAAAGTKTLTNAEMGTGESARADRIVADAGLRQGATEQVLVRSGDRSTTAAAARALEARLRRVPEVRGVTGPSDTPDLSIAGGRTVLVQATMRGDPDDAKDHVAPVQAAVAAVARDHPHAALHEAGTGTVDKAFDDIIAEDLQRSEVLSLPITLVILLGFTNTGAVADWLPLFAFVILFGLSMDYTILVLERIREARRAGASAREAAAEGVAATAGTVTSAAIVMVAVFAIFGTMRFADMKQLGVGLSIAILLDATIVRAIALPAAVALLGERRWRVPRRRVEAHPARGVA